MIWNLCREMKIHPHRDYGLKSKDLPELVTRAQKASSMKGNPAILSEGELFDILESSI